MMLFLLHTILWIIGVASFTKILHISIQDGQWLGSWQRVLRKIDNSEWGALSKPLGNCELCFSHLITFLSFWCYLIFMSDLGLWAIHSDGFLMNAFLNLMWYIIYISIGTQLGLYFIVKLFK